MGSTCSTFCNKKCVLAVFSGQNCRHFWVNFGSQYSKILEVAQKYPSKSYEKHGKMRKTGYFFREIVHKMNPHNPKVAGSNPSSATKKPPILGGFSYFYELFEAVFSASKFFG